MSSPGSFAVGGATGALIGVQVTGATGTINLTTGGNLIVNDRIVAPGNVTLSALGASSDVIFQHNTARGVASNGGTMFVHADRDIVIGSVNGYGDVGGQTLHLDSGRDILLNATSYAESNGAGGITAIAGRDLKILQSLGGGSILNSNGGGAPVNITTGVGGTFTLDQGSNGGVAANGGNITLNIDSLNYSSGNISTTTGIRIQPNSANRAIDLGTLTVGKLSITNAAINNINAGTITIGGGTAGDITLTADMTLGNIANVRLQSGGNIVSAIGAGSLSGVVNLSLIPGVNQSVQPRRAGNDHTVGSINFPSSAILQLSINGNTADVGYDRLVANGTINLANTTLNLTGSYTPTTADSFILVSGGTISGTFTGLPNNSILNFNGQRMLLTYSATAVTLSAAPPSLNAVLNAGTLTITDTLGDVQNLTVILSGANLVISDPLSGFIVAPAGGTLSNGARTLTIPASSVTSLDIQLAGSNDQLTVSMTGGAISQSVTYDGGTQTSSPGDVLVITGGTFTQIVSSFTGSDSGQISFGGQAGTITYTGLEPVDMTGTSVGTLVLNLPIGSPSDAVLESSGSFNQLRSTSGTFETTIFASPTNSLSVYAAQTSDTLIVNALPNFGGSMFLASSAVPFRSVTFAGDLTLNTNAVLNTTAHAITLNANVTTSGAAGNIRLYSDAFDLASGILDAGVGTVRLEGASPATAIDLGGNDVSTTIGLTDAELDRIHASILTIASQFGGITISAPLTLPASQVGELQLITLKDITATNNGSITAESLALNAATGIGTISHPLATIVGTLSLQNAAGNAALVNSGRDITVTNANINSSTNAAGSLAIQNAGNITINGFVSNGGGDISLSAMGGLLQITNAATPMIQGANNIALIADEIDIASGSGTVLAPGLLTVLPSSSRPIVLGGLTNVTNSLTLTASELAAFSFAKIRFGNTSYNNTIRTSGNGALFLMNDLELRTSGAITLNDDVNMTGILTLAADSLVTLNGVVADGGNGVNIVPNTIGSATVILASGTLSTLSSSSGVVTVNGTIDGTNPNLDGLLILAPAGVILSSLGESVPLGTLQVNALSGIRFNATSLVVDANDAEFVGNITLNVTLTAGFSTTFGGLTLDQIVPANLPIDISLLATGAITVNTSVGTPASPFGFLNASGSSIGSSANKFVFSAGGLSTSTSLTNGDQYLQTSGSTTIGTLSAGNGTIRLYGGTYFTGNITSSADLLTGTIAGTGTLGSLSIQPSATLSPGNSPGIINSGNLALTSGSVFRAEINGTVPGTGYDQVVVNGTVDLGSSTLNLVIGSTLPPGKYTLISNDGNDPVIGIFAGHANNSPFRLPGGPVVTLHYDGGDGNDVVLEVNAQDQNLVSIFAVSGDTTSTLLAANGNVTLTVTNPFGPNITTRTVTADLTGDGVPDLLLGSGSGIRAQVLVIDGASNATVRTFSPFEEGFTGGVQLASADFDRDGFTDAVVTADFGGGGRVIIYSGKDGTQLADFFGIEDEAFRGGARLAVGDINGDGIAELVVAAGVGGGPRVAIYDGATLTTGNAPRKLMGDFFAFEPTLRDGLFVAVGDVNGDGAGDLILGGGPGGGPRVQIYDGRVFLSSLGATRTELANFFAEEPTLLAGARVAAKDLDGDTKSDVVVIVPREGASTVRAYYGKDLTPTGTPQGTDLNSSLAGIFVG